MMPEPEDRKIRPPCSGPTHPEVAFGKVGILISNLGTPDGYGYWQLRRYLSEFLSDRRVIDYPAWKWQPILQMLVLTRRPFSSGKAYRSIWNEEDGESPLLTITRKQTDKLRDRLHARFGDNVEVQFGMRYGNPSTRSGVNGLNELGCNRLLHFPLYPQYSATTTASANDELFRALMKLRWQPAVRTVPPYFDHPRYIEALATSVNDFLSRLEFEPDAIVASYHGLPERYLRLGDPYHCHCAKTSRLLADKLGAAGRMLVTTFQSRFGREKWLTPYTSEEVAALAQAGRKRIVVMAPGFSADCIETLEEISGEIRESFEHAGGERFAYVPCLNDSDDHVAMMLSIVGENLAGWVG